MAEDVTSILRKKVAIQPQPVHEGPMPGELASEILRGDHPELALEMPAFEAVLERRSALQPLGPETFAEAVPFGPRRAFKGRAKVGMRGDEE